MLVPSEGEDARGTFGLEVDGPEVAIWGEAADDIRNRRLET